MSGLLVLILMLVGWEPIFEVEGEGVTLAEMEVGKKVGFLVSDGIYSIV